MDDEPFTRAPHRSVRHRPAHRAAARRPKRWSRSTCGKAQRLGLKALRIIHGRGVGVQREIVRAVLGRTPFVADYGDAPAEAGGWGAWVP